MEYYEEFDDMIKKKKKGKDHSSLLDSLREIEDSDYELPGYSKKEEPVPVFTPEESSFCPSDLFDTDRKKGKKGGKKDKKSHDPDAWFNDMITSQASVRISKKSKLRGEIFDVISGDGKKKKKKKKDGSVDLVDYKKEFEPEVALLKNLLVDQTKFTDNLQHEYDALNSHKSSARGVNKQMSDLIENINEARSLSLQIVKELVNGKKLVSDLTLKQKKELGASVGEDGNISDFANNYMKQLLNNRGVIMGDGNGDGTIADYSDEELFSEISSTLSLDENASNRPSEIDLYLKYENRNVKIYVVVENEDFENYEFVAKDEDGEIIEDYPLPNKTTISVNKSTGIATDVYGQKYNILYE